MGETRSQEEALREGAIREMEEAVSAKFEALLTTGLQASDARLDAKIGEMLEAIRLLQASIPLASTSQNRPPIVPNLECLGPDPGRRILAGEMSIPLLNTEVKGVIDEEFEGGYIVTVKHGDDNLRGVLYNREANPKPRRKNKKEKRNPSLPKPNRSGYTFYFSEQHEKLKGLYQGRITEISKIIGGLWANLKDDEKSVYQEKASKDKERYAKEMEEYRVRLPDLNEDPMEKFEDEDEEEDAEEPVVVAMVEESEAHHH